MHVPRRQRGISFLGWVAILLLVGFAGYVAIQIGPPYAQYITIVKVVEGIHEDRGLVGKPMPEIRSALNTRLRLNEADELADGRRTKDLIFMNRPGGNLVLDIDYEVEKPLVGNVYLLLKFQKRVGS